MIDESDIQTYIQILLFYYFDKRQRTWRKLDIIVGL